MANSSEPKKQDGTDAEQRKDARKVYEGIIGRAEKLGVRGARRIWRRLLNRYAASLDQIGDLKPSSEAAHPDYPRGYKPALSTLFQGRPVGTSAGDDLQEALWWRGLIREKAQKYASEMEYDPSLIEVSDENYEFEVGGEEMISAAQVDMKRDWTPCHAKEAEFVKIAFDDGQVVFGVPKQKKGAA